MSEAWISRPRRVFQHLLREVDAIGLDPADLIAEAREMGADTYLCMGGGFSAWYPTDIPGHVRNPHLETDVVGGVMTAARTAGLRVILRMDISKSRPGSERLNPDDHVRAVDGSHPKVWEMPQTCPTGAVWETRNFEILDELLVRYPLDGIFYNYFTVPTCHCARCSAIVLAETGAPPPTGGPTPAHEAWRARRLAEYAGRMRTAIRRLRPTTILAPYHHVRAGWDSAAVADNSDLVISQISNPLVANPVDPQPIWSLWAGEEIQIGRALKPDAAPVAVQSGSAFFASRQTALPAWRMNRNLILAAAHGGGTAPALNGRLAQDDPRGRGPLRDLTGYLSRNSRWYDDLASVARIAVLRSEPSLAWGPDSGRPGGGAQGGHVDEFRGASEMLSALRRPFDMLPTGRLSHPALAIYDVVIVPGVCCISDADLRVLDAFATEGGTLVATGAFAARDAEGAARRVPGSQALAALPGAPRDLAGGYFAVACGTLREALGGAPHIGAEGPLYPVAGGTGWEMDLRVIEPAANNAPEFTAVAAPGDAAGHLLARYGAGIAHWLPWHPGALYHRTGHADLLAVWERLVRSAGPAPMRTTAPVAVDMTLYRHPDGAVVHALNGASAQGKPLADPQPLAGFDIEIDLPARRIIALRSQEEVSFERTGDGIRITLERLDDFAAFALIEKPTGTRKKSAAKGAILEGKGIAAKVATSITTDGVKE